jgi:hypothetical protein
MRRHRLVGSAVLSIVLCACGATGGGDGDPDAKIAAGDTLAKDGSGGGCIFPCDVPAPTCADECTSTAFLSAGCTEAGTCSFSARNVPCDLGCDKTTGACNASACGKIVCGQKTSCGGVCGTGSGCCSEVLYDQTTGLAPSGSRACCKDGDTLVSGTDCGTGTNHGFNKDGLCVVSWEGAGNGGTPCATAHCKTLKCGP